MINRPDIIVQRTSALAKSQLELLAPLDGARILMTGATGFFGTWILRLLDALSTKGCVVTVHAPSRRPDAFLRRWPDLSQRPWLHWYTADAAYMATPDMGSAPTHILHMAASSDARIYAADPFAAATGMLASTNACIKLARHTGAHLHFVSSGAVYGVRRALDGPAAEDQVSRSSADPLQPGQVYGNAKRMCETLVATGVDDFCISRPFAFFGPLLPLDQHFAAGNFIADAVRKEPVTIRGDGTPLRSYMHPADLALWLLALLARPGPGTRGRAVNVGSSEPISVSALAGQIAGVAGSPPPRILGLPSGESANPHAYWPDISHAKSLGLSLSLSLEDCIRDTLAWARTPAPALSP